MTTPEMEKIKQFFPETTEGNDENFNKTLEQVGLIETIMCQFNDIFIDTLYADPDGTLAEASVKSVKKLRENFVQKFVVVSLESGGIADFPSPAEVSNWIGEIHKDIASQLYTADFNERVLYLAIDDIAVAICDLIEEGVEEVGEVEEDTKECGCTIDNIAEGYAC